MLQGMHSNGNQGIIKTAPGDNILGAEEIQSYLVLITATKLPFLLF